MQLDFMLRASTLLPISKTPSKAWWRILRPDLACFAFPTLPHLTSRILFQPLESIRNSAVIDFKEIIEEDKQNAVNTSH
jgi:hypothetical protein